MRLLTLSLFLFGFVFLVDISNAQQENVDELPEKVTQASDSESAPDQNNKETKEMKAGEKDNRSVSEKKMTEEKSENNNKKNNIREYNLKVKGPVLFGKFTKNESPILIERSVIIPAGQVLELEAGTEIYVKGYSTIIVFGQIIASGTKEAPVLFKSASAKPNPWDWDRIYCRTRNRCVFENCVVSHSNFGIFVENGSVKIEECVIEKNSLNGLVVKNSDADVKNTLIQGGHVLSILCDEGGIIRAENLIVKNNITGIACNDMSEFQLTGGKISSNRNAIAIRKGSSVNIVSTDIINNENGVVSEQKIPDNMMEMVYDNNQDLKKVDTEEMNSILKSPQEVKSVVLPKAAKVIKTGSDFKPGFSALKAPRQQHVSFIGNFETGLKYIYAKTDTNKRDDSLIQQTRYIEGDDHDERIQPELRLFMQGKRKNVDVNLNANLHANKYYKDKRIKYMNKDMFVLGLDFGSEQELKIGDFYENSSETSISGRKLTGFRYSGGLFDMGRGEKRINYLLAGGESEAPKDAFENDPDIPNMTVDTGFSVRQQLTYIAGFSVKPRRNVVIGAKGIISKDQTEETFFRNEVDDPAAPSPVISQTGIIDAVVTLFDGDMEITAEVDIGTHDSIYYHDSTLSSKDDTAAYKDLAWYKPRVLRAVPDLFKTLSEDKDNFAGSVGVSGIIKGYDLGCTYTEIAPNYFSAGNPYLESDRRLLELTGEKKYLKNLTTSAQYKYERTYASDEFSMSRQTSSPTDKNYLMLDAGYSFGSRKPAVSVTYNSRYEKSTDYDNISFYTGYIDTSGGTPDTVYDTTSLYKTKARKLDNELSLDFKQRPSSEWDYSLRYRIRRENDMSDYADESETDMDDAWQHEISVRAGFKIKRIISNRLSVRFKYKNEVQDSLKGKYVKFSDNLRIKIIPRKLSLNLKGTYDWQNESEYDSDKGKRIEIPYDLLNLGGDIKYSFTSKLSSTVSVEYEEVNDRNEGGENYHAVIGGFYMTYLF